MEGPFVRVRVRIYGIDPTVPLNPATNPRERPLFPLGDDPEGILSYLVGALLRLPPDGLPVVLGHPPASPWPLPPELPFPPPPFPPLPMFSTSP